MGHASDERRRNFYCMLTGYLEDIGCYARHMPNLVEETNDLASNVLSPGLFVVHDTGRGGENNVTELTRWQELDDPLLEVTELDVVAGRDDTGLVEAVYILVSQSSRDSCNMYIPAVKLDDDLAVPVVVDLLELANVA